MNPVRLIKLAALLSALSFLFVFGMGCSNMKEATAAPVKVTPVPPAAPQAAPKPAVDYGKIEGAAKRAESAATLAEAAAKKAELAAQKAEIASGKAEKAAGKAEAMANKAESIFMKKMKK
ncbi:MAG: hypothetical protein HY879_18005 [Deltaproteobacteria bacterium]|nr:hypothetical protein [Deltaproteobacteria bacterium]